MRKAIVAGVLLAAALVVCAASPQSTNQSGGTTFPLLAPGGSQGAPSYAFATQTNFGMYLFAGTTLVLDAGGSPVFQCTSGSCSSTAYGTATNCSSSASPAVCGSAASGSVTVAAAATTEVVNTTAVTASSQVQLTFDSSLGTKLGVTCNTTVVQPTVSARTGGTSFTITVPTAPTTNPACFSYTIIN